MRITLQVMDFTSDIVGISVHTPVPFSKVMQILADRERVSKQLKGGVSAACLPSLHRTELVHTPSMHVCTMAFLMQTFSPNQPGGRGSGVWGFRSGSEGKREQRALQAVVPVWEA